MAEKLPLHAQIDAGLPGRFMSGSIIRGLGRQMLRIFTPDAFKSQPIHYQQRRRASPTSTAREQAQTAYLDGLRGFACIAVLNYHFLFSFSSYATTGYGCTGRPSSLVQLPLFRLLYDGATAVNVFFAVAGYVCSIKPLRLMGEALHEQTLRTLCRSMFRSVLRLYLPVLVVSFTCANLACFGAYELLRPTVINEKFPESSLRQEKSWGEQIWFWAVEIFNLTNLWHVGPFYPEHDQHLWSVAFELRMRLHLYTVLLALSLCRPRVRLCGLIASASLYLAWDRWEGPLFFLGAALAQWNLIRHESRYLVAEDDLGRTSSAHRTLICKCFRLGMYAMALYLMSFPIKNVKYPAPGFVFVNDLIPSWYTRKEKFPKSIGVLMLLYLLETNKNQKYSWCQRVLTSDFAQYLGRTMFAVYLIHGPVAHLFGLGVPILIWSYIGRETAMNWWTGLIIGWLCNLAVSLWLADVFTREIDSRLARLVQFAESKLFTSQT